MMKSSYIFLLVYLLGSFCEGSSTPSKNAWCTTKEACEQGPNATSHFLQCVGLPPSDTGRDHLSRLKGMLEATMDVYTFMRSSMTGVPLLSLEGALHLNQEVDPLQNQDLVQMWLQVKMRPLLKSITKHFLSCLSTKNFSCSTYQTVVKQLSYYYSEMDPVRQKWIYTFFMYPFLSGNGVSGCVNSTESSEEWLMKNFGAFRVMARMKDFSALNMLFSGLDVLHLLSQSQIAELMLRPEVQSLDNGTLSLVFHSMMTGGMGPLPTANPGWGHNWTSPGYPNYGPMEPYEPYPPPPQNDLRETVNGFMTAFKPLGSFIHNFVTFTNQRDVSEIRSTTLAQFMLNWTLAEVADMYRSQNSSAVAPMPQFDVTKVEDWYQHVVMPVLRRFLPGHVDPMDENIRFAFHRVFYLDHDMYNESSEIFDVCSITLDKNPCGLTDVVENVAKVLHCAAKTNLMMTEETIMKLIVELAERLNLLIKELSTVDFKELEYEVQQIFNEKESPSLTQEHLEDPEFIQQWFKIKLMPLLPAVHPDLLACLSTKNFSCQVYQTIVAALSQYMTFMNTPPMYSKNIYEHFIFPFLLYHNGSDPQCVSSANSSAEWLRENFGFFSRFASVLDFYKLNPRFMGLEVLPILTPLQLAEMLLLPLPTPPEKDVVISRVFDFLTEPPAGGRLLEVLHSLIYLAQTVTAPCYVYEHIFIQLYKAIPSLPPDLEPQLWAGIDELMYFTPPECLPENITCPETQTNGTADICEGTDSSNLQSHLTSSMQTSCNFTLEEHACARLENFTANQLAALLKCDLPGNTSHSRVLWKMLLTKLSFVLDPALDQLANMPMAMDRVGSSATEILDVLGEIRLSMLTDEQLMNSSVIDLWFSNRLSSFLPSASGRLLLCLSNKNISCHTYQQILKAFIQQFDNMTLKQQLRVLKNFILHFLQRQQLDPGCVSATNNSSTDWLIRNFGPFSRFLSLEDLLGLNPQFNPLEALALLTAKQNAELLLLDLPILPDREVVLNTVLDQLTQPAEERKLKEFLSHLVMLLQPGTLSCSAYRTLFTRLDAVVPTVSVDVASSIVYSKMELSKFFPPGCVIYSGQCNVTMTNETDICIGVNSTELQLRLNSSSLTGRLCDFGVEEIACASLDSLTAEDLTAILKCNRSSNMSGSTAVWKLLLSKASHVLDDALDQLFDMMLDPNNPALPMILDSLREIRLDTLGIVSLNNPTVAQMWFSQRLRPFLPAISQDFLSCLATNNLSCSTYQHIVRALSRAQPHMTPERQRSVYTHLIKVFLTRNDTTDPSCSLHTNSSGQWLQLNLGAFAGLLSFQDIQMIYPGFSPMEALPQLEVQQLAQLSATPGQLTSSNQVNTVMDHVPNQLLGAFFDDFSPAIMGQEDMFPSSVRSAMLQVVFDRANLSDHSVSDTEALVWLHDRLRPLLVGLSPMHVAPFFGILAGRNCSIGQQGVMNLNQTISTLSGDTQKEIHGHIIQSLQGPTPLRCYSDDHSFYSYLVDTFMGFQFPNLTTFLLLIPHDRTNQLVNSMPPSHLGELLRRPDVADDHSQLCDLYGVYTQTPVFLAAEHVVESLRSPTLQCVWPTALASANRSEVNLWFNGLRDDYLPLLTRSLISPNVTHNASCVAFQKLVSVLGDHNYTAADFERQDVFSTIRDYLTSATVPRCYDASDPELNSTAWFAQYIGAFMVFLTLEDLQTFGSQTVIQVFTVDPLNIALINHDSLPVNLTNYYTQLIYQQDSNFNPLVLPPLCWCVVPGPAFSQLTSQQSRIVLHNLTALCTDVDPQVSAALASNFGDNVTVDDVSALGSEITGLSSSQLGTINAMVILASLSSFSNVTDWRNSQARVIIQALMASGMIQINSSSLLMLGSLVRGLPSNVFTGVSGSQLITVSQHSSFLQHMSSAPLVVQQIFVNQIISQNSTSAEIIENVPDDFATEIPRAQLLGLSGDSRVTNRLNRKRWRKQQAELFFSIMATETTATQVGSANNLSTSVLQGFTCTGVRTIRRRQIRRLIRACRRGRGNRVPLVETQLTCMYNYLRDDSEVTSFDLYPPDVLLYYDYSLVPAASCRSYFEQLGDADFFVFSSTLAYRRTALFDNARRCLGITNTSLTKDTVSVLGNMCCVLNGSYIQNSDPSILDTLNNCQDLGDDQAAAVEALLLSGNTQYGPPDTWTSQTLVDLRLLPVYLSSNFYDNFDRRTKRTFLRYFLRTYRVRRQKRRALKRQIRRSIRNRSKRSTDPECTVGEITQVTISDETFPFDYFELDQFSSCLSALTVRDNLDAIAEKVDLGEHRKVVLSKLNEAYNSSIPEDQVQNLGAVSREASVEDIGRWTITEVDTLASLMESENGEWNSSQVVAIVSKYLSVAGNKLGSAELNSIGGTNLCFLDIEILKNISQQSLREANALNVTSCSSDKQKELFNIANQAFAENTRSTAPVSAEEYRLTQPYIGGADADYVRRLAVSNISMDMVTFTSMNESVVLDLTVDEVKGLLGANLPELKSYEDQPLVRSWIGRQLQSELDELEVGVTGGRADPATSTTRPTTTVGSGSGSGSGSGTGTGTGSGTGSGSGSGSVTTTTSSPTTADGVRIRAGSGLSLLVLLTLLITSLTTS
ncbi:unnamed protein product [Ophioblennius macclurei]